MSCQTPTGQVLELETQLSEVRDSAHLLRLRLQVARAAAAPPAAAAITTGTACDRPSSAAAPSGIAAPAIEVRFLYKSRPSLSQALHYKT